MDKYHLPPTSEEYERYTPEELWLECYEDYYTRVAAGEADEIEDDEDENVRFVTGDPEVDALEKKIEEGTLTEEDLAQVFGPPPGVQQPSTLVTDLGDGFSDGPGGR